MLTHVEKTVEKDPPISWILQGRAFVIHNREALVKDLLRLFFGGGKFTSFTRKLYRWGFRQISVPTSHPQRQRSNEMNFGHEYFQRDNKQLMVKMKSITAAGRKRAAQRQGQQHSAIAGSGDTVGNPTLRGMQQSHDASLKRSATQDLEKEAALELKRRAVFYSNQRLTQEMSNARLLQPSTQIAGSQALQRASFYNPALFQQAGLSPQAQSLLQDAQQSVLQNSQQFLLQSMIPNVRKHALQSAHRGSLEHGQQSMPQNQQQSALQAAHQHFLQTAQQNALQQAAQQQRLLPIAQQSVLGTAHQNLLQTAQQGGQVAHQQGLLDNVPNQRQYPPMSHTPEGIIEAARENLANRYLASLAQGGSLLDHNVAHEGGGNASISQSLAIPAAVASQSNAPLSDTSDREDSSNTPSDKDAGATVMSGFQGKSD